LIIWVNHSSVIEKNLEYLRRLRKPAFVYEVSTSARGVFYALE
jgi:hypothetical protein